MRIALYGGSFNPVHLGHKKLARLVIDEFSLDKLIVMPTYSTPLKDNSDFADSMHRLNMCRIAFSDINEVEVSDMEIQRKGNSYTYLTLCSLKEIYLNDDLFLVVGADMFMTLHEWKNPKEIFSLSKVIVINRNSENINLESQKKKLSEMGCQAIIYDNTVYDVSSTEIRKKLRHGKDVSFLLDSQVYEYIKNNNLYGA